MPCYLLVFWALALSTVYCFRAPVCASVTRTWHGMPVPALRVAGRGRKVYCYKLPCACSGDVQSKAL